MTDSAEEATLRHFKTVLWPQAYRTGDGEMLARMLHDSFEMVDAEGNVSTKADELDYVENNHWDPGEFEYRIERLSIYDNGTAVITGQGVASSYSYRSSNALVKQGGEWRAVNSHVSGVVRSEGSAR
ncbi:MAG: nuclear transport factor 2 family protein [Acidimicrobiia bacterium]|nr:nuclear transport factor 2 family protein [Acidimicrobiia bacterium]